MGRGLSTRVASHLWLVRHRWPQFQKSMLVQRTAGCLSYTMTCLFKSNIPVCWGLGLSVPDYIHLKYQTTMKKPEANIRLNIFDFQRKYIYGPNKQQTANIFIIFK